MYRRVHLARAASALVVGLTATARPAAASPIVTGTDAGPPAHVKAFDGLTLAEQASFLPYALFAGGVRVAVGDVTGDGRGDILTGAGPGASPHVKVFNGQTLAEVHTFFAYDAAFAGGVFVASGDLSGDRRADLFTGAGSGATHVKVFNGNTLALERSFFAFAGLTGGVRVAAGDVNGDGRADVIAGTGAGAGQLKVFDAVTNGEIANFSPFGPSFTGGIFVAAGDLTGDGRADLIAGTDQSGVNAGTVRIFNGETLGEIRSFIPYPGFTGGVRVGAGDVTGDGVADVITGTGPGAAHVKVFDGVTGSEVRSFLPYAGFTGGIFVAGETPVPEPALAGGALSAFGFAAMRRGHSRPAR
jgi:hypothetical protein